MQRSRRPYPADRGVAADRTRRRPPTMWFFAPPRAARACRAWHRSRRLTRDGECCPRTTRVDVGVCVSSASGFGRRPAHGVHAVGKPASCTSSARRAVRPTGPSRTLCTKALRTARALASSISGTTRQLTACVMPTPRTHGFAHRCARRCGGDSERLPSLEEMRDPARELHRSRGAGDSTAASSEHLPCGSDQRGGSHGGRVDQFTQVEIAENGGLRGGCGEFAPGGARPRHLHRGIDLASGLEETGDLGGLHAPRRGVEQAPRRARRVDPASPRSKQWCPVVVPPRGRGSEAVELTGVSAVDILRRRPPAASPFVLTN